MSESKVKRVGFEAVNDNDESLKSKTSGNFGLNTGHITKLEFNPTAGKDNEAANAVDIEILIGDRTYKRRIYEITGALYKAKELVEPADTDEYNELYNTELTQRMAVVIHAVKAVGVTEKQINTALATEPADFKSWAETVCGLVPSGFEQKAVDVFLEYQWNIAESQDRTYVELPKNMKGGRFLSSGVKAVGKWTPTTTEEGLIYKDDAGNEHPFNRSSFYMESNKAIQQIEGQDPKSGGAIEGDAPKKSNW